MTRNTNSPPTWNWFPQWESHVSLRTPGEAQWLSSEVKPRNSLQPAKFKPLSTVRGAVEEKASRRGHQQEGSLQDISDMPLWLVEALIKHSFGGLVDRQTHGRVFRALLRSAGPDWEEWDRKWGLRWYFLLGAEKTLLSYYNKKWCKMIR